MNLLFVSRGFGMSHAIRSWALATEVRSQTPEVEIVHASYADGLAGLRLVGQEALDLGLPSLGEDFRRLPALGRLLQATKPDAVVSDAELLLLPVSELLGVPSVFVTNWLAPPRMERNISYLMNATHVIMADCEDSFPVPPWLSVPLSYVGPICRRFDFTWNDRRELKRVLGLPPEQPLVLATAGGGSLPDVEFFRSCCYAFSHLYPDVNAVMLGGSLAELFGFFRYNLAANVRVESFLPDLPRWLAASDLVVTRGGHSGLWELALLGVPSLCLPHSPVDDPFGPRYARLMERRGTTIVLPESCLASPTSLAETIQRTMFDAPLTARLSGAGLAWREGLGTQRAAEIVLETALSAR